MYSYVSAPSKAPSKISWQCTPLKAMFNSVVSDAIQSAQWSPGVWVASATFDGMVGDTADTVGSWLLQIGDGTYRTFWYDYSRSSPRGVGTGTPLYANNWCIDPNLSTPADWTLGSGWAISGNKLTATAASTANSAAHILSLNSVLIAGLKYTVTYKISGYTAGSVEVQSAGAGGTAGTSRGANGTFTDTITIGASGTFEFTPTATFSGSIDATVQQVICQCTDMHLIKTTGWTSSTTNILKAFDWFDVLASGHRELKRLIASANSDANGVAILFFKPILRNYPADATPLTITNAGTYYMLSQDAPWTVDLPRVSDGITIQLIEDIKA